MSIRLLLYRFPAVWTRFLLIFFAMTALLAFPAFGDPLPVLRNDRVLLLADAALSPERMDVTVLADCSPFSPFFSRHDTLLI